MTAFDNGTTFDGGRNTARTPALGKDTLIDRQRRTILVLVAAMLLSTSLGSIHAFSVLLEPFERQLGASRAEIAFAYSLSLGALTLAVLIGHRIYRSTPPAVLAALTCIAAACGLIISALAAHPSGLWLGYGLIFGFANGVGYGYALYMTNQAVERHRGLAMGSVTAIYAIGASGFAKLFEHWGGSVGSDGALLRLSLTILMFGAIATLCLWRAPIGTIASDHSSTSVGQTSSLDRRRLGLCWLIYGSGVAAGLMAMGHAAGIVTAAGGTSTESVRGAVAITFANALGGFGIGYLADRQPAPRLLIALGAASASALLVLAITDNASLILISLAVVGFTYGSIIALFPIVTSLIFGRGNYALAYGRTFTSWGLAGFVAPWLAGVLYGHTGGYGIALVIAALLAALSAGMSLFLTT
ncbi:MAG: hypothetical protein ACR2Q4_18035, partial [Geminicoccaceae bacterium]